MENKENKTITVESRIKEYILVNNLNYGDKLPTETKLADEFGVSRASIREALRTLEGFGIIESIQGKGSFVKEFDLNKTVETFSYSLQVHFKDFTEVVMVRQGLEFYFLPLAMKNMDEKDLEELERIIDEMEEKINNGSSYNDIVDIHAFFHKSLYKKINNKILDSLISIFSIFQKIKCKDRKENNEFIKVHRDLVSSLRTKDEDRLRVNLKDHYNDFAF